MTEDYRSAQSAELSHMLLGSEQSSDIATSEQGLTLEESKRRFIRDG